MNKNLVIAVLAVMLVLGSLWGQIGNKSHREVKRQLEALSDQVSHAQVEAQQGNDVLSVKSDELQKAFQVKSQQLAKARQELVRLRKSSKVLEVLISEKDAEKDAAVAAWAQEKNELTGQVTELKKTVAAAKGSDQERVARQKQVVDLQAALKDKDQQLVAATRGLAEMKDAQKELKDVRKELGSLVTKETENVDDLQAKLKDAETTIQNLRAQLQKTAAPVQELQEKLARAESVNQELRVQLEKSEAATQEFQDNAAAAAAAAAAIADQSVIARANESLAAQIIGFEKMIEEKNATIEETSKELDRREVNMDVLLSRISEQQDTLQELRDENRGLLKELTARNQELADMNEQLIQTPVLQ